MWMVFTSPNNTWGTKICCLSPWEGWGVKIQGTVLLMHCRKVCVYVCACEDGFCRTTLTYQFSNYFCCLSLSPPLWLADKKTATATILTVFSKPVIVFWVSVEGRLKIISSGAIWNGGRQQNIHSSLLLNSSPATLWGLINVMLRVSIYAFMLTWLWGTRHSGF